MARTKIRVPAARCLGGLRSPVAGLTALLVLAAMTARATWGAEHAAAASQSVAYEFHIPAQGLCEALQAFARMSRQQVTFDSASLSGKTSPGVTGRYTAEEALRRLLQGTDATFRRGEQGVWMIVPRARLSRVGRRGDSDKALRLAAATSLTDSPPQNAAMWSPAGHGAHVDLEELVISASRIPQEWRRTSSSVSVISLREMAKLQVVDLKSSLSQQPGVTVVTTGTVGGVTSVYIRGAYPHHTLFIVDGVRMNDRSATYDAFLGGSGLGGLDRVEVLRGPQSPMYGSAAMGGVILLDTARGTPEPTAEASASVGSFETVSGAVASTGTVGRLGYSAALRRFTTANDQPHNSFDSWSSSARLDYAISREWSLGMTYRGQSGTYESNGSRVFQVRGLVDSSNDLGTLRLEWRPSDAISSRVIAGYHRREYRWTTDSVRSEQVNERTILEWQTAWTPVDAWSLVAGASFESSDYDINSSVSEEEITAGFISGTWHATQALTVTGGIRRDHFDTVGDAVTWRAGVAWMVWPETKLRATYGSGFAAPGSSDRHGVPVWGQHPNPDLRPEKSRGWDIGVDRTFTSGVTLSATWFGNRFRDLIDWTYTNPQTQEGMFVNRSRASTRGVELGLTARPLPFWHVRVGYTWLEGKDDDTGERLRRRPRHSLEMSSWLDLTSRWTVGFGLRGIEDRVDSVGPVESYRVARLFSSFDLPNRLSLKVRAENLFDERYDEVYGYAALPRGVYGSVEWQY